MFALAEIHLDGDTIESGDDGHVLLLRFRESIAQPESSALSDHNDIERPTARVTCLSSALSFALLFHSLNRRLHQLLQDLPVHIVQFPDIQTPHAGCELAKFLEQVCMRVETVHQV